MAAEVIGSAYVRIRAITAGLAKEIQEGLEKSSDDLDTERVGGRIGDDLGRSIGDQLEDSSDELGRGLRNALDDTDLDDAGARISRELTESVAREIDTDVIGDRFADELGESISDGLAETGDEISDGVRRAADRTNVDDAGRVLASKISTSTSRSFSRDRSFVSRINNGLLKHLSAIKMPFAGVLLSFGVAFGSQLIGPILQLLGTYILGLVGQLGLLVSAAGGAGAALLGAFGPAALVIAPLVAAFSAQTEEMAKLADAGKRFIDQFQVRVGRATQRHMLPPLEDVFEILEDFIPMWSRFGRDIGRTIGVMVKLGFETWKTRENTMLFQRVLDGAEVIVMQFGRAFVALMDTAAPLFAALVPIGEQFAEAIAEAAENFQDFVNRGSRSGELARTFQTMYDNAVLVWNVLEDITVAIWNIFVIGAEEARPGMQRFSDWAREFRDYTESRTGRNRIRDIFEEAMPVFHEVNGLIADIFRALFGPAVNRDSDSMVAWLQDFREETLPQILEFVQDFAEDMQPHIEDLVEAFGDFFEEFQEAEGVQKAIDGLTTALDIFAAVLSIPGVGTLAAEIIGLATAFAILNGLSFGALAASIRGLAGALDTLWASMRRAPALGAAGTVVGGFAAAAAIGAGIRNWLLDQRDNNPDSFWGEFAQSIFGDQPNMGFVEQLEFARDNIVTLFDRYFGEDSTIWNLFGGDDRQDSGKGANEWLKRNFSFEGIDNFGEEIAQNWEEFSDGVEREWDKWFGPESTLRNLFNRDEAEDGAMADVNDWFKRNLSLTGIKNALSEISGWFKRNFSLEGLENVWEDVMIGAGDVQDWFKRNFSWTGLKNIGGSIIGGIVEGITDDIESTAEWVGDVWTEIKETFEEVFWMRSPSRRMMGLGKDIIGGLVLGITQNFGKAILWFAGLPLRIIGAIGNVALTLAGKGAELIGGLIIGMMTKALEIAGWVAGLPGQIVTWVGEVGLRLWNKGIELIGGLIGGAQEKFQDVREWFGKVAETTRQRIGDVARTLWNKGGSLIVGFLNGARERFRKVVDWFRGRPKAIRDAIGDVIDEFVDIGRDIAQGLIDGLEEKAPDVTGAFSDVASKGKDVVDFIFGRNSPSREMRDLGHDIIAGWVIGLNERGSGVEDTMRGVATSALTAVQEAADTATRLQIKPIDVAINPQTSGLDALNLDTSARLAVEPVAVRADQELLRTILALRAAIDEIDVVRNENTFNEVMPDAQAIASELEYLRLRS